MSNLEDRVRKEAAKLWGKPESQVYFELDLVEYTAAVYAYNYNPYGGSMYREVIVLPKAGEDPETSEEYYVELLQSLLDVLQGAVRRGALRLSLAYRGLN
jgi:hypothetical protein